MNIIKNYLQDFLALFFPELCSACGQNLFKNEQVICTNCTFHLPYTNFHTDAENKVVRQLWGRFQFLQANAFLHFSKGGKVQNLIHELKYNNSPETGYRLGELYGNTLANHDGWVMPDLIVPVPLHKKKLKKRGYNQSEFIAAGLSASLKIPVETNLLSRRNETETQTRKSRYNRYENMKDAFAVNNEEKFAGKHLFLIDDVMTTGATFEACALELQTIEGIKLSIGAIAFAE
ncbi:MAG TPA: ComF family protein [Sphingobacteriaceae bacterium]